MSLSKVISAAILGLEPKPIEVEVDIGAGLPAILIVGLPAKEVDESKERVKSAIKNSNAIFPTQRITINLAPADLPKTGPAYDLPIAVGVLAAAGQIPHQELEKSLFVGELSLNGDLRHINGVLPISLMAKEKGFQKIFVPYEDGQEASIISGIKIYAIKNLTDLILMLKNEKKIKPEKTRQINNQKIETQEFEADFANIKGQESAKRALEIASSGGHNVLMIGPPGSGKTLLSRALPSILPNMSPAEILEVSKIYSIAGLLPEAENIIFQRPFRNPHHTASDIALVGGGQHPRPGEITLAHRGVLFLDELPEFNKNVLEVLRQPLEDKYVTVARAAGTMKFPADFILIAAMNPCPCGYLNDPIRPCTCTPSQIVRYQKKISGPLLDRIDLYLEVPRVKTEKLTEENVSESSAKIRERVEKARKIQLKRFAGKNFFTNSSMKISDIKEFCVLDEQGKKMIKAALQKLNLSARSFHRILKISRTIADLAGEKNIKTNHIAEALQYRPKDS